MTIRVIQWSTGNVGKGVLRAMAERDEESSVFIEDEDRQGYEKTKVDTWVNRAFCCYGMNVNDSSLLVNKLLSSPQSSS